MGRKQLDDLLVSALMSYEICGNGPVIRKVAEKLASKGYYIELKSVGENGYGRCLDLLSSYGSIIEANVEEGTILALVGSGIANMNPTALAVNVTDEVIRVIAVAKEGLINQKSAEKAVQHFSYLLMA